MKSRRYGLPFGYGLRVETSIDVRAHDNDDTVDLRGTDFYIGVERPLPGTPKLNLRETIKSAFGAKRER